MERGQIVVAVFPREFRKPRPALVIQSSVFDHLESVALLPLTTDLRNGVPFRLDVLPTDGNGLRQRCQIMIDKPQTVYVDKIRNEISCLDPGTLRRVNVALALFLGLV
ncbi:MAG: type II toxin-antitoxin system PemK/MazF family toxin [Brevundimonas sp.]|uniref:type II toxin-antitoxin system PemK/MazF family toxin n=1 Tax=Brevundimonas sp. TaxID=1871086 RepID=UPI0027345175|nr:type II toxin-antitoxin system PemK/MazF family toxin [Brevundimonas sp.]MDP3404951.1 type II toxin-antitoxin system PemK/MazF family toxin [Brevundimonas sp.]